MPLTESQKAYRARPEEREKRRLYALEWRRRPAVMERDAERKRQERQTEEGAKLNRERVKRNRLALGRGYMTSLLHDTTGIAHHAASPELVLLKREQISLRRLSKELLQYANESREEG